MKIDVCAGDDLQTFDVCPRTSLVRLMKSSKFGLGLIKEIQEGNALKL